MSRIHRYHDHPGQLGLLDPTPHTGVPPVVDILTRAEEINGGAPIAIERIPNDALAPEIDDADLDKLLDHGFSRVQAERILGRTATAHQSEAPETVQPPKASKPQNRRVVPRNDRRRLSAAGKRIADEPPAHERKPY